MHQGGDDVLLSGSDGYSNVVEMDPLSSAHSRINLEKDRDCFCEFEDGKCFWGCHIISLPADVHRWINEEKADGSLRLPRGCTDIFCCGER